MSTNRKSFVNRKVFKKTLSNKSRKKFNLDCHRNNQSCCTSSATSDYGFNSSINNIISNAKISCTSIAFLYIPKIPQVQKPNTGTSAVSVVLKDKRLNSSTLSEKTQITPKLKETMETKPANFKQYKKAKEDKLPTINILPMYDIDESNLKEQSVDDFIQTEEANLIHSPQNMLLSKPKIHFSPLSYTDIEDVNENKNKMKNSLMRTNEFFSMHTITDILEPFKIYVTDPLHIDRMEGTDVSQLSDYLEYDDYDDILTDEKMTSSKKTKKISSKIVREDDDVHEIDFQDSNTQTFIKDLIRQLRVTETHKSILNIESEIGNISKHLKAIEQKLNEILSPQNIFPKKKKESNLKRNDSFIDFLEINDYSAMDIPKKNEIEKTDVVNIETVKDFKIIRTPEKGKQNQKNENAGIAEIKFDQTFLRNTNPNSSINFNIIKNKVESIRNFSVSSIFYEILSSYYRSLTCLTSFQGKRIITFNHQLNVFKSLNSTDFRRIHNLIYNLFGQKPISEKNMIAKNIMTSNYNNTSDFLEESLTSIEGNSLIFRCLELQNGPFIKHNVGNKKVTYLTMIDFILKDLCFKPKSKEKYILTASKKQKINRSKSDQFLPRKINQHVSKINISKDTKSLYILHNDLIHFTNTINISIFNSENWNFDKVPKHIHRINDIFEEFSQEGTLSNNYLFSHCTEDSCTNLPEKFKAQPNLLTVFVSPHISIEPSLILLLHNKSDNKKSYLSENENFRVNTFNYSFLHLKIKPLRKIREKMELSCNFLREIVISSLNDEVFLILSLTSKSIIFDCVESFNSNVIFESAPIGFAEIPFIGKLEPKPLYGQVAVLKYSQITFQTCTMQKVEKTQVYSIYFVFFRLHINNLISKTIWNTFHCGISIKNSKKVHSNKDIQILHILSNNYLLLKFQKLLEETDVINNSLKIDTLNIFFEEIEYIPLFDVIKINAEETFSIELFTSLVDNVFEPEFLLVWSKSLRITKLIKKREKMRISAEVLVCSSLDPLYTTKYTITSKREKMPTNKSKISKEIINKKKLNKENSSVIYPKIFFYDVFGLPILKTDSNIRVTKRDQNLSKIKDAHSSSHSCLHCGEKFLMITHLRRHVRNHKGSSFGL